jgi:formate transporter
VSGEERVDPDLPPQQYVSARHVLRLMGQSGRRRVMELSAPQILVLAVVAGAFITAGALFSLLLATGVGAPRPKLLLEGIGFSSGFFFVILSDAALFTEANVAMPATLLAGGSSIVLWVVRFWVLAFVGNLIGAVAVGWTVHLVQHYPGELGGELQAVIQRKLAWRQIGGPGAWFQIVGSGILANWLVGMAAFFSVMSRTIFGKYIPVMLAVTLFVSANLQHSPANMGYFSLATSMGIGPGWGTALGWNIVPAAIGNLIGGTLLVALPFWYGLRSHERRGLS